MAVAFLLGSLSDLVAAIAALLTLLRIILSFLLWFVPACCLLLFLGWPMVEDRLIKPLICEKKLRSYFGASDVHIRRVRVMWSGPTITLECHDTRVGSFFRLRLLRVRTTGLAGFLSLPGILRLSEMFGAEQSPPPPPSKQARRKVLNEGFLHNFSMGCAVREMDTVEVEGLYCHVAPDMENCTYFKEAMAKKEEASKARLAAGKKELHNFRRKWAQAAASSSSSSSSSTSYSVPTSPTAAAPASPVSFGRAAAASDGGLDPHHHHHHHDDLVHVDDGDGEEDDDEEDDDDSGDYFSVARKVGMTSMSDLVQRLRAKRAKSAAAKQESSTFKACGLRFYDGPTLRIGRITCCDFQLVYEFRGSAKDGTKVVKQRRMFLGGRGSSGYPSEDGDDGDEQQQSPAAASNDFSPAKSDRSDGPCSSSWTELQDHDAFPGENALVGPHESLAESRRVATDSGFGGFVVFEGKAYYRAHAPSELRAGAVVAASASTLHIAPELSSASHEPPSNPHATPTKSPRKISAVSPSPSSSSSSSSSVGWEYIGFYGSERELNNLLMYNTSHGLLPTMAMEAGKEAVLETVNTIKERMRVKQAMMAKRVEEKKSQLKSIIGERFGDRLRGFRGGGTLSGSGGGRDANTAGARTTPPPKAKPKANQKKEE